MVNGITQVRRSMFEQNALVCRERSTVFSAHHTAVPFTVGSRLHLVVERAY